MKHLLKVQHLSVNFRTNPSWVKVVHDLTFCLDKGETLGLVGESGSGKSVTALTIMGLIKKSSSHISGNIIYRDKEKELDLLKIPEKEVYSFRGKKIAMIFQEPATSLNPVLTCGFQVMETIINHKKVSPEEALKQTLSLFEKVQLQFPDQVVKRYPHQLSGGQKQRVMIAMAISCNPDLLIADEPTTAIDVTVQRELLKLLKSLQRETGMAMLFISHDLSVVAQVADRVMVMKKGEKVEEGSVEIIFNQPQHSYTKALLACHQSLIFQDKRLKTIGEFVCINESEHAQLKTNAEPVISPHHTTEKIKEVTNETLLLKVKNISTYFFQQKKITGYASQVKAVDNVSFEVRKGETMGLVGQSGSGKTTLGRTILGLIKPLTGSIMFNEKDLLLLQPNEMRLIRKHIQIIFQDPYSSLNPKLKVGEALTEPLQVNRIHQSNSLRKEKAMEWLLKVNLKEEHFYRYPFEFSSGQRQRICIARALICEPELVICDECVSALDVSVQAQILNLLNDLKNEMGFTSVFISHDLSVVRYMSDRMMVMHEGKIVEMGDTKDVCTNPKSIHTRELLDASPKGMLTV